MLDLLVVRRTAVEEGYTETYFNDVSRVVSFSPRRCAGADCTCGTVRVNVYYTTSTVRVCAQLAHVSDD
jgi:hypothetical protein